MMGRGVFAATAIVALLASLDICSSHELVVTSYTHLVPVFLEIADKPARKKKRVKRAKKSHKTHPAPSPVKSVEHEEPVKAHTHDDDKKAVDEHNAEGHDDKATKQAVGDDKTEEGNKDNAVANSSDDHKHAETQNDDATKEATTSHDKEHNVDKGSEVGESANSSTESSDDSSKSSDEEDAPKESTKENEVPNEKEQSDKADESNSNEGKVADSHKDQANDEEAHEGKSNKEKDEHKTEHEPAAVSLLEAKKANHDVAESAEKEPVKKVEGEVEDETSHEAAQKSHSNVDDHSKDEAEKPAENSNHENSSVKDEQESQTPSPSEEEKKETNETETNNSVENTQATKEDGSDSNEKQPSDDSDNMSNAEKDTSSESKEHNETQETPKDKAEDTAHEEVKEESHGKEADNTPNKPASDASPNGMHHKETTTKQLVVCPNTCQLHKDEKDTPVEEHIFDIREVKRTCSIDCADSCQNALGGKTQCILNDGNTPTCTPFDDSGSMECSNNYKPCAMPFVMPNQKFQLKASTKNNNQGEITVKGAGFNDCIAFLLADENGACTKDNIDQNILNTRHLLDPTYTVEHSSDEITFSNVKVQRPGHYKICLYQQFAPTQNGWTLMGGVMHMLEGMQLREPSNVVSTVYSIDAGTLIVE